MKFEVKDIATVPNVISATGFALAVHGASHLDTQAGIVEATTGRTLDLLDGHVARALGQSSEFGAAVDATLDKLAGAVIIANEWQKDTAPKISLLAIIGQNLLNGMATVAAAKRHPDLELSPTKSGKHAMATQNLALAAYAQSEVSRDKYPRTSRLLRGLGHTATAVGVGYFGVKATTEYIRRAR